MPRQTYWTIVTHGRQPTAFRGNTRESLQTILNSLRRTTPSAKVVWFDGREFCEPPSKAVAQVPPKPSSSAIVQPRHLQIEPPLVPARHAERPVDPSPFDRGAPEIGPRLATVLERLALRLLDTWRPSVSYDTRLTVEPDVFMSRVRMRWTEFRLGQYCTLPKDQEAALLRGPFTPGRIPDHQRSRLLSVFSLRLLNAFVLDQGSDDKTTGAMLVAVGSLPIDKWTRCLVWARMLRCNAVRLQSELRLAAHCLFVMKPLTSSERQFHAAVMREFDVAGKLSPDRGLAGRIGSVSDISSLGALFTAAKIPHVSPNPPAQPVVRAVTLSRAPRPLFRQSDRDDHIPSRHAPAVGNRPEVPLTRKSEVSPKIVLNPRIGCVGGPLNVRVERDAATAAHLPEAALRALTPGNRFSPTGDLVRGIPVSQISISDHLAEGHRALRRIAEHPFDAMLEAEVETVQGPKKVLWYAHKDITQNQVVSLGDVHVNVVAWTHAGFQMGLSGKLNQRREFRRTAFAITAISTLARARYSHVLPSIAGLYDPGGEVAAPPDARPVRAGLKAIKLEMTPEQVEAFISRMNGMLMVTGAPGTGKTTVAFQRIRFLFDQQDLQDPEDRSSSITYAPALTRVFLASPHLITYSRRLLKDELQVPAEVVSLVPDFIGNYVETTWQARGNARPITREIPEDAQRAREALLNLCRVEDLSGMWAQLEKQARSRLQDADAWDWLKVSESSGADAFAAARGLAAAMGQVPGGTTGEPTGSPVRLDAIWSQVRQSYGLCRERLTERQRDRFDRAFASWLFWVFDPIDVLSAHVSATRPRATARIVQGTGDRVDANEILSEVLSDWEKRLYGVQELSWIAWVLRFVMPEEASPDDSFRGVPRAIPQPDHKTVRRWTHVVIDEAQDLAVQEASLLASFVDRRGALTVSADFHQVVSPVHGMTDAEALKFGLPIWDRRLHLQFPFQRNLRQCREIAQFLQGFYQKAFGEFPPFEAGDREEGLKPQLYVGQPANFAKLVAQMVTVFRRTGSLQHLAVVAVNDNPAALAQTRRSLKRQGLSVAPDGVLFESDQLMVTSVERAKGLEFDACVILGLDDVDHASMNFAKNRAYVALSRPTRRLFMLCETYPSLLEGIPPALFDRHTV